MPKTKANAYKVLLDQTYPDDASRFNQRLRISRRNDGTWRVSLAKYRKGQPISSGLNLVIKNRSLDHAIVGVFDQAGGVFDKLAYQYLEHCASSFYNAASLTE